MTSDETVVKCPAKVLITGGYLILSQNHKGCSIALTSYFHCKISSVPAENTNITISSPQFIDKDLHFDLENLSKNSIQNKYIHFTLLATFLYLSKTTKLLHKNLSITIQADNEFYSQANHFENQTPTFLQLQKLPKFMNTNDKIENVHKTGLGSSAALVTSLCGALLQHYNVVNLKTKDTVKLNDDKTLIHNLSQVAHCLAQEKVGSGFDVSSAVFGSQLYTRFNPLVLNKIFQKDVDLATEIVDIIKSKLYIISKRFLIADRWDSKVVRFNLPYGLKIYMGDVNCGTNTPEMVRKVLNWKNSYPELSTPIWESLNQLNDFVITGFQKISSFQINESYKRTIQFLSQSTCTQWKLIDKTNMNISYELIEQAIKIQEAFESIRYQFRLLSEYVNVGIEPQPQTKLLNDLLNVPGVLMCGVPGAGGYDAIFIIVFSDLVSNMENEFEKIEKVWETCEYSNVSLLPTGELVDDGIHCEG